MVKLLWLANGWLVNTAGQEKYIPEAQVTGFPSLNTAI